MGWLVGLGVRLDGRAGMCEQSMCIGAGSDAGWESWHCRVVDRHTFTIRYNKDTYIYIFLYHSIFIYIHDWCGGAPLLKGTDVFVSGFAWSCVVAC